MIIGEKNRGRRGFAEQIQRFLSRNEFFATAQGAKACRNQAPSVRARKNDGISEIYGNSLAESKPENFRDGGTFFGAARTNEACLIRALSARARQIRTQILKAEWVGF